MQIVESAEDLLTFDLSENEKIAYTDIQKDGFRLMFEYSENTDDIATLNRVLAAPTKTADYINHDLLKKQKEARKVEAELERQADKLKKEEKKRIAALKLEAKKAKEQTKGIVEVDQDDIALTTKPKSLKSKEPKYKGNFSYRLSFTMIAELFDSTATQEDVAEVKNVKDFIIAKEVEKPYVYAINDLYILTREEYLEMLLNAAGKSYYITQKPFNGGKYALVDSVIIQHLRHERTIGVFAGQQLAKFICFDIDNSKDLEISKVIAADVIDVLVNIFKIDRKYIVTSYSGNKGYHVELFFGKAVDKSAVKRLYKAVLPFLKPFDGSLVELRPTGQGLKVPLSVHKQTGNVCNYVDDATFEEIGKEKMLNIDKMPIATFQEIMNNKRLFTLSAKKAEEMEKIIGDVKPLNKTKTQKETNIVNILSKGQLARTHSRHDVTFRGAVFLFSQGQLLDDTIFLLKEVMDNTFLNARHLIDSTTTRKIAYDDIIATTNYVYQNNIVLADSKPEIVVYQSEMERIFDLPKMHLKVLAFSILQHSKKFAKQNGEFFMTYSSMSAMGNDQNRQRLLNSIVLLQEAGFLKIVSRNVISEGLSIEYGRIMSEPNHYKLTFPTPSDEEPCITINTNKKIDFYKVAPKLINRATLKAKSTIHVYKKYFK